MSNFVIFKAAFNNSATPAIGTYTAEGATAQFNRNTGISPDYYLYNTADDTAVQWFVPTAETTDFEFVADILTRYWNNRVTYFIIADSTGTTRLRMWSRHDNWDFENSDSTAGSGDPEYIGTVNPTTSGGFGVFHQFRVRVRKLTASSSSVEVYVDGTLKLTATAGAALITCAKIGFVGGVDTFGPGTGAGIKNAYAYDLSGGDVVSPGVLSGAFNRFISWMKSKFALKSDIPTVNDATLTIQKNGTNVATFTANQSTAAIANITVPTAVSELTNDSGYLTSSSNLDASKLTSGTVDIARLPQGALERLVKVANEGARYALTTADVQLGDTVQQLDTGIMYVVTDTDHLDSAAGYTEYTAGTAASVPWSGVTGKPTFAAVATSGAYSDLTGTPTIPTVNNATLTIQQNGVNVQTFTANQATAATANIQCVDLTSAQTIGGNKEFTGTTTAHDLVPSATDTYNFGSSTAQWNNLYAQTYYYNGTAWGLNEVNEWTDTNTFSKTNSDTIQLKNGRVAIGETLSSDTFTQFSFKDKNTDNLAYIRNNYIADGTNNLDIYVRNKYSRGSPSTTGSVVYTLFGLSLDNTGKSYARLKGDFYPYANNLYSLGTSTNKWKSFNGINPGALSLPSISNTGANAWIALDTTDWAKSPVTSTAQKYTPPADGWLNIRVNNAIMLGLAITGGSNYMHQMVRSGTPNDLALLIPVFKNTEVAILVAGNENLVYDRSTFYPCQGNV